MVMGKLSLDNYFVITGEDQSGTQRDEEGKVNLIFPTIYSLALSLFVTLLLTLVMTARYFETGKFMPAGMVAGLSVGMSLLYIYKMLTKREHTPRTKQA